MARPIAGWLVAAMLGLAACGGNGSAEPSTTSVVPSTTSTSTTTAATTTTTTLPVTTTISALDAEKAKVEAAYRAVEEAYISSLLDLDNYDPADLSTIVAPGPWLDLQLSTLANLKAQGRRARPNSPDIRSIIVESVDLSSASASDASVTSCYSNNLVIYEPGQSAGPEDDVIVNDALGAHRFRYQMVKAGGVWKVLEGRTVMDWPGTSACPPP